MRSLVAAMEPKQKYNNRELRDLCRSEELFSGLVSRSDDEMDRSQRSAWGRMLSRYHDRAVGEHRFFSDGKEHKKRFWVEPIRDDQHGLHGLHGVPTDSIYTRVATPNSREDHADHVTMQGFESMHGQHGAPHRSDDVPLANIPNGKDHATMQPGDGEPRAADGDGQPFSGEIASQPLPYGEYFTACLKSGERALSREKYEALPRIGWRPQ
jgi:hypothetical protein